MFGTAYHGISVYSPTSGVVEDNFVQGDGIAYGTHTNIVPWIIQQGAGDAFEIQNNVATAFSGWPSDCCGNRLISNAVAGDRSAFDAFLSSHGLRSATDGPVYAEGASRQLASLGIFSGWFEQILSFLRNLLMW